MIGNDTSDYLKAWGDEGISINLIGKDGFGTLKAGAGDIDTIGLVQAMYDDEQTYKREQKRKEAEAARKKAIEDAKKRAEANKNAVNLDEGAQLGDLDANPITDFNDPLKTALNGQLGNITFTDSPVGSNFSPTEESVLASGTQESLWDTKVTQQNVQYVSKDDSLSYKKLTEKIVNDAKIGAKSTFENCEDMVKKTGNEYDKYITLASNGSILSGIIDSTNEINQDNKNFGSKILPKYNNISNKNSMELKFVEAEVKLLCETYDDSIESYRDEFYKYPVEIAEKEGIKSLKPIKKEGKKLIYEIPGKNKGEKVLVADYKANKDDSDIADVNFMPYTEHFITGKRYWSDFRRGLGEASPYGFYYGESSDCVSGVKEGIKLLGKGEYYIPDWSVRTLRYVTDKVKTPISDINLNKTSWNKVNKIFNKLAKDGTIRRNDIIIIRYANNIDSENLPFELFDDDHVMGYQGLGVKGKFGSMNLKDQPLVFNSSGGSNTNYSSYPLKEVFLYCQRDAKEDNAPVYITILRLNKNKLQRFTQRTRKHYEAESLKRRLMLEWSSPGSSLRK